MLKTLKSKAQGFVAGVFVTIVVIGAMHLQIDFHVNPSALEMQQTEKIATQLEKVMPARTK